MGLFFYTKIGSIISIGDLPTTNIIEPFIFIFGIPLHSFAKKGVTNRPYFKKRIEKRIQHLSHPKNNLFSTEDMGFEPTHAITRLPRFQHGLLSLLSNLPILTQIVYHKGSYLAIKILEIRKMIDFERK